MQKVMRWDTQGDISWGRHCFIFSEGELVKGFWRLQAVRNKLYEGFAE